MDFSNKSSAVETKNTPLPEHVQEAFRVARLTPRLLSLSGAVAYSATSRATLYKEMKAGSLKYIKLNGATRIELKELDRWIDAKAAQSVAA